MTRQSLAQTGVGLVLMAAAVACGGSAERLTTSSPDPAAAGGSASAPAPLDLVGSWQLVSATPTGQNAIDAGEPGRFTADFATDGRVSLRADCNRCAGGYTATTGGLTVGPMACTRAYCSSAPLDTTFTMLVSDATAWTVTNGRLELRGDSGVLRLRK
jgi:heat shock protein HslJ